MNFYHKPVLLAELEEYFAYWIKGEVFIDCTLGGGGHSLFFLRKIPSIKKLIGIDVDPEACEYSRKKINTDSAASGKDIQIFNDNFANITGFLNFKADGVFADLGVSSYQLDKTERGFSFKNDALLDMRMTPNLKVSAKDIIKEYSYEELKTIFKNYGEEKFAAKIAAAIVNEREINEIITTKALADLIYKVKPRFNSKKTKIHPATKVFQALRIEVNNELGNIKKVLPELINMLNKGGRLAVISFHSLEDRIVKNIFREFATDCICNKKLPVCTCGHKASVKLITKKPIVPGSKEILENPRARSSKLRILEKIV